MAMLAGIAGCRGLAGEPAAAPASGPSADANGSRPTALSITTADYLLLGEVHDNRRAHARRLAWLRDLPASPCRALVFEQFDREHDVALASWRAEHPGARGTQAARALAEAGGFAFDGWDYEAYSPVLELALERGWEVRAGNLSRAEAMAIARGTREAAPAPRGWTAAQDAGLVAAVREGHCGMVSDTQAQALALAQRSRDMQLAEAMRAARADGCRQVVLLAGNGHVRRNWGVPAHLHASEPDARIVVIGFLESTADAGGSTDAPDYDVVETVRPQPRPDPCAGLRERFGRSR